MRADQARQTTQSSIITLETEKNQALDHIISLIQVSAATGYRHIFIPANIDRKRLEEALTLDLYKLGYVVEHSGPDLMVTW